MGGLFFVIFANDISKISFYLYIILIKAFSYAIIKKNRELTVVG